MEVYILPRKETRELSKKKRTAGNTKMVLSELAIVQFQVQPITGREHKKQYNIIHQHMIRKKMVKLSVQEVLAQLRARNVRFGGENRATNPCRPPSVGVDGSLCGADGQ